MKRMLILVFFLSILALPAWGAADPGPEGARPIRNSDPEKGPEAIRKPNDWAQKIQELENELETVRREKEKMAQYLEEQKKNLDRLEGRKTEMKRIRRELDPFLKEVTARLETFVHEDLDFLTDERQRRVVFLQDTIKDYRIAPGEKVRRVMEALQVEAKYGQDVEASIEELVIGGERIQVNQLRVGRLALFYRTPDGRILGRHTKGESGFSTMAPQYGRDLKNALDIAERRRSAELIDLPIPNPKEGGATPKPPEDKP